MSIDTRETIDVISFLTYSSKMPQDLQCLTLEFFELDEVITKIFQELDLEKMYANKSEEALSNGDINEILGKLITKENVNRIQVWDKPIVHIALEDIELLELLFDRKANLNCLGSGKTPLLEAVYIENLKAVEFLLQKNKMIQESDLRECINQAKKNIGNISSQLSSCLTVQNIKMKCDRLKIMVRITDLLAEKLRLKEKKQTAYSIAQAECNSPYPYMDETDLDNLYRP